MTEQTATLSALPVHGGKRLPSVEIDSYNLETKDDDGGFLGDRVNKEAFDDALEQWRKTLRKNSDDPLGKTPTDEISKSTLDALLTDGAPEAIGVLQGAIEDFAKQLALVIRRLLKLKSWQGTERIVIGGGFRESRFGELAIGRASVLLKADKIDIGLVPIRSDPDDAGLIGAAHLAPAWMFKGHDAILAVDIGGTNIRAGVVELNLKRAKDLSKAAVWKSEIWRHADENRMSREDAIERLVKMLRKLIGRADKEGYKLAPFIGVGCPGIVKEDGSIDRGAQNLPGNWESSKFNLPQSLCQAIPRINDHDTIVLMHNDAVVQGLSEAPFMGDIEHWGVLTIGTGLGNARFTNRANQD